MEKWKNIEDYPIYEVSNIGRVRSIDRIVNCSKGKRTFKGRILSIRKDKKGYCTVNLYKNGSGIPQYVHRLVAKVFIPNPNNLPVINHKDENPLNNTVQNLEWMTNKENVNYGTRVQRVKEDQGIHDAERKTGIPRQSISYAIKHKTLLKGFQWEVV